jgi:hypothetical protein
MRRPRSVKLTWLQRLEDFVARAAIKVFWAAVMWIPFWWALDWLTGWGTWDWRGWAMTMPVVWILVVEHVRRKL